MPSLVRKLTLFATVNGLVLQPTASKSHHHQLHHAICIDYQGRVGPWLKRTGEGEGNDISEAFEAGLEAHGIIGLVRVATSHFLVVICGRELVAQIRGKPVYKVTRVALIPLASQAEATAAIASTRAHLRRKRDDGNGSESEGNGEGGSGDDGNGESDIGTPSVTDSLLDEYISPAACASTSTNANTSTNSLVVPETTPTTVAEDVMQRKGLYGRFANKWFSRKGWSADQRRLQGLRSSDNLCTNSIPTAHTEDPSLVSNSKEIPQALAGEHEASTLALLPKILQTTTMYFSSGNFFFSYDYDISHGVAAQQSSHLPLFKQFDPLFFWNHHIVSSFIDAGQHAFVLPLIQGFVGQRPFTISIHDHDSASLIIDPTATPDDIQLRSWHEKQNREDEEPDDARDTHSPLTTSSEGKDFLLTVISRRSTKRAGLRYLRRGVDDEGCTANSVESEQILSTPTWDTSLDKIFSFTQFRGSIPLFFSQSPYSLKPQVATWGSFETNAGAFKRHFTALTSRYGNIFCASLIDKHGNEAKIGELYEKHASALNENWEIDGSGKKIWFEWFDFHNVCRGMRFENVSLLMDTVKPFLKSSKWVEIADETVVKRQTGILRTNCMDCLDRTNVVQSACARTALEAQLSAGSYNIDLQHDPSTSWFNTLWADNGDAISRQYAGTAALKGDFTRTRKRQLTGALTDFGLTLTRYYNNIVNDYFTQAVIDHLLGRAPETIFADFEADMKSSDYFIDVRKVRQQAIDRCASIVIEDPDNQDLLHGWTLSTPTSSNKLKTPTFEEAILLLTDKALYFCRLDWGTEKVREFQRIGLEDIQSVVHGVYITSTLAQRHMDTSRNVGFVVHYEAHMPSASLVRRNTRALDASLSSDNAEQDAATPQKSKSQQQLRTEPPEKLFLAFKALPPPRPATPAGAAGQAAEPENEEQVVHEVCTEIVRVVNQNRKAAIGSSNRGSGSGNGVEHSTETDADADADANEEAKRGNEVEVGSLDEETVLSVQERDIISLSDAKKQTGYLEQWEYSLKKLVWG